MARHTKKKSSAPDEKPCINVVFHECTSTEKDTQTGGLREFNEMLFRRY